MDLLDNFTDLSDGVRKDQPRERTAAFNRYPIAKREIEQWQNVLQPSFISIPERGSKAAQLCDDIENLPQDLFTPFPPDLASHDPLKIGTRGKDFTFAERSATPGILHVLFRIMRL